MTATAAKPTRPLVTDRIDFLRCPEQDTATSLSGLVMLGDDSVYKLTCERLPTGTRVTFRKDGGGESVVRVSAGAEHCSCKGWAFSRGKRCRHISTWVAVADRFDEPAGDEGETVADVDAACDEMDGYYAGAAFNWEG
jgi:hypothetical protein